MEQLKSSVEKNILNLSDGVKEFLVYQRENGMVDSTIEVMLSLIKFTNEKKSDDYIELQKVIREVLSTWINFRPIKKSELINIEELIQIESNEKVFPGVSREYWYRRLYGGAILAELGNIFDKDKNKHIVRFLGGIFFQITKGNCKNFGELTNNRKFDHDPTIGDRVNFYSVSTEESYRDYKFHLGSELVFKAAEYVRKSYPNVKIFQTFSPFTIEKYAVRYLENKQKTIAPQDQLLTMFTLAEKSKFIERVFSVYNELRQNSNKKNGNFISYSLGFIKGKFDYLYTISSKMRSREKLFREVLSFAIEKYSNKENSIEVRNAYYSVPEIRRVIRRVYEFLAPYYLKDRDDKGRFLNPVENFHLKNGATPGEVIIFGATEIDGKPIWGYTAGGLCCIRYIYPDSEEERLSNSKKYLENRKKFLNREKSE